MDVVPHQVVECLVARHVQSTQMYLLQCLHSATSKDNQACNGEWLLSLPFMWHAVSSAPALVLSNSRTSLLLHPASATAAPTTGTDQSHMYAAHTQPGI